MGELSGTWLGQNIQGQNEVVALVVAHSVEVALVHKQETIVVNLEEGEVVVVVQVQKE